MDPQLPEDLERFVTSQVQSGRLAPSHEVIAAAVRLFQRQFEIRHPEMILVGRVSARIHAIAGACYRW